MKEAIQKAIEGGWKPKGQKSMAKYDLGLQKQAAVNRSKFWERYCLDPLFWQALGKAMGDGNMDCNPYGQDFPMKLWQYNWHSFIDHLAKGKSADEFFKELLTPKP
jgi:hypothetical protein